MTQAGPGILDIPATLSSPRVLGDPDQGSLLLAGESYPENSFEFYRPIATWVAGVLADGQGGFTLEVRLSYLNTSSIKCLIDLLDQLEEVHRAGRGVLLNWYYDEEDDRAMELAGEFKEDLTLPFHIIPLNRER